MSVEFEELAKLRENPAEDYTSKIFPIDLFDLAEMILSIDCEKQT